jgi:hypothetical protein
MQLIFDSVCVEQAAGRECYPPDSFIQQPLHLRIQYILEKKISFWMQGQEVEFKEALSNYRKWSVLKGALMSTRL